METRCWDIYMGRLIHVGPRFRRQNSPQNQRDKELRLDWRGVKFRLEEDAAEVDDNFQMMELLHFHIVGGSWVDCRKRNMDCVCNGRGNVPVSLAQPVVRHLAQVLWPWMATDRPHRFRVIPIPRLEETELYQTSPICNRNPCNTELAETLSGASCVSTSSPGRYTNTCRFNGSINQPSSVPLAIYSAILSCSMASSSVGDRSSITKSGQSGRNLDRCSGVTDARRSFLTQDASGERIAPLGSRYPADESTARPVPSLVAQPFS